MSKERRSVGGGVNEQLHSDSSSLVFPGVHDEDGVLIGGNEDLPPANGGARLISPRSSGRSRNSVFPAQLRLRV